MNITICFVCVVLSDFATKSPFKADKRPFKSPEEPLPKIHLAHTIVPATPGKIPGINKRTLVQKENLLLFTARMHSAKINGGIKAFNRSVRRRISILEADDQNCVFLITEITLNCFCLFLIL